VKPPVALPSLPPSRLAEVDGRTIEFVAGGSGRPVIVLVNGAGGPLTGWARVYGPLAELGTVVAYNRPGIGRSSAPHRPQTSGAIVADLCGLLDALEVTPPYVLVGHSIGGLHVQLFARRHADEVAAVVLVESAHPDDRRLSDLQPGWLRAVNRVLGIRRGSPYDETRHVDLSCAELTDAPGFPDVPLVVVSGGRRPPGPLMPAAAWAARQTGQRALVALAPGGQHVVATRSGHFPQLTEPDVVVDAVRRVVDASRPRPRSPAS